MSSIGSYTARQFDLSALKGISDETLEMHFKLYEGYVKETNKLTERISEFISDGNVDQEEMPAYSELTRRLGFEYNRLPRRNKIGICTGPGLCFRPATHADDRDCHSCQCGRADTYLLASI